MSSNKKVRQEIERIYGKGCMYELSGASKIYIKGYKKFKKKCKFKKSKEKKLEEQMSLHHLKHRSEGGKTTVENTGEVASLPHMFMHSLPREEEEKINDMIREYKNGKRIDIVVAEINTNGIQQAEAFSLDLEDCDKIPLEQNTEEDYIKYIKHKEERNKRIMNKFKGDER